MSDKVRKTFDNYMRKNITENDKSSFRTTHFYLNKMKADLIKSICDDEKNGFCNIYGIVEKIKLISIAIKECDNTIKICFEEEFEDEDNK